MPSSTSNFEREIPDLPWRGMVIAVLVISTLAGVAWEMRARSRGYRPTLNDTADLWAQERAKVKTDSIVIVGDSRPLFDLDLDALEAGLGSRPLQLAIPGSCAYPILADLAADTTFSGTVICSIVPGMWMVPAGPLLEHSELALKRFHNWTLAQRTGHFLGMLLEERVAFLKQEDLTLPILLQQVSIPNRPGALVPPQMPPYFQELDRDRRCRMADACARPGPLQTRVREGWPPLFTPPPPPTFIPPEAFQAAMGQAAEARFKNTAEAVGKIRARGGKVVFVRFPISGPLREMEDRGTPRVGIWNRIMTETAAPNIYFEDHPELSSFECPEWSHLSAPDSVEFTKRLVPHLKVALAK
ncbi:MAG: hypothetical protein ABIZ04_08445 [Opitutus sp.]